MFLIMMIPFIGTFIGAVIALFIKDEKRVHTQFKDVLYGLSSGIMVSAAIFSLLIPAMDYLDNNDIYSNYKIVIGFVLGFLLMILIDKFVDKRLDKNINNNSDLKKTILLFVAIVIHNIPEGIVVGMGLLNNKGLNECFALSLGIAIQNIPEGIIATLPFKNIKSLRNYSFLLGVFSGIVEPIFSYMTLNIINKFIFLMPYMLFFAASTMMYVVIKELIPSIDNEKCNVGIISFFIGFIVMMVLDICLG